MNDLKAVEPGPSLEKSLIQFVNDLEVAIVPMLVREQLNTQVSSLKKLLFQASKNKAEENKRVAIEETKAAVHSAVAQVGRGGNVYIYIYMKRGVLVPALIPTLSSPPASVSRAPPASSGKSTSD